MLLQLFLIDLCPHKDKLILHYIDDILSYFLSRNETSRHKNFIFEFLRTLKCVTKRECVTSKVRKDVRGNCTFKNIIIKTTLDLKRILFKFNKVAN